MKLIGLKFRFFQLFLALILAQPSLSQVVINEYSAANWNILSDSFGEYEDYIELYNAGSVSVDIGFYFLSDKLNNPTKWQFPASTILNPGDFLLVFASGRNIITPGELHTNFNLTQTRNEHIVLSDPFGLTVDVVQLIPTQINHARGRFPDGANFSTLFINPTPGNTNATGSNEYAPTPLFGLPSGGYTGAINLSLINPDPNTQIHYTTDGSEPTTGSTLYTSPINVSQTTVIKARAFHNNPGTPPSFVETNTYFIDVSHELPVLSISGNGVANLFGGNQTVRIGSLEYFDEDLNLIDESVGNYNKHGNDSWAYQQRGVDFICRDQFGYNAEIRDQLFPIKEREDYQRLIIKAAANDNYPFANGAHIRDAYVHTLSQLANLNLDERTSKFCVVYLNGAYWGLYDMREKVDDHDFTEYYYQQDKNNLQYLKTWGGTWSEYGGATAQTDWNNLRTFILGNDMSQAANFQFVDSLFDWKSLIDYVVLNSYIVCSDWLNWNTGWWRGLNPEGGATRWRYTLWDMDASFGHYINYTGIPNTNPDADPCDPEFLNNPGGQGHIPILNQLFTNETFQQYYISRFIDLANSHLSCNYMQHVLDSMLAVIEPEMPAQIQRWGGNMTLWEAEVLQLKTFIDDRCTELAAGLIDCYDITGPYPILFKIEPELSGQIQINSLLINQFPFSGDYYGDINLLLEAIPENDYVFDYWEMNHHALFPQMDSQTGSVSLYTSDTIIAHFKRPYPIVDLGTDTAICLGTSILLSAENPGAEYLWNNGSTSQNLVVNEAGAYSVTVSNGSYSANDEIQVEILMPPTLNLSPQHLVCANQTIQLDANPQFIQSLEWSNGETGNSISIDSPGVYWATGMNSCGETSDTTWVEIGYTPDIDLGPNQILEPGEQIFLNAFTQDAIYLWQDESTNSSFIVEAPGYYWVLVENICGTTFDDIQIETEVEVIVPNAISPNQDGLNDEWEFYMRGIVDEGFELSIYNRLGEQIFFTSDINQRWDGHYKGNILPEGAYVYFLAYKDFAGNKYQKNGIVVIVR